MSDDNRTNRRMTTVSMRNISNDPTQSVISFSQELQSSADEWQENYKLLAGKILGNRDTIVITKEDQLMDLISDAVQIIDRDYVYENLVKMESFTPNPESLTKHHATLVKTIPVEVVEDLVTSAEFIYGNLWLLVSPKDCDGDQHSSHVIDDVRKLTPSSFNELPHLTHEALASPAMYDGREILWFKPNEIIYQNVIKPLFEN